MKSFHSQFVKHKTNRSGSIVNTNFTVMYEVKLKVPHFQFHLLFYPTAPFGCLIHAKLGVFYDWIFVFCFLFLLHMYLEEKWYTVIYNLFRCRLVHDFKRIFWILSKSLNKTFRLLKRNSCYESIWIFVCY